MEIKVFTEKSLEKLIDLGKLEARVVLKDTAIVFNLANSGIESEYIEWGVSRYGFITEDHKKNFVLAANISKIGNLDFGDKDKAERLKIIDSLQPVVRDFLFDVYVQLRAKQEEELKELLEDSKKNLQLQI